MKNKKQDLRDLFNIQSTYPQKFLDSLIETISLRNNLTHTIIRKGYEDLYISRIYEKRLNKDESRKIRPCILQSWKEESYMYQLGENLNLCLSTHGKLLVRRMVERYKSGKYCNVSELSSMAV